MADAYWIGQDGNIYFKGDGGITNRGSATDGQFQPTDTGLIDKYADYAGQPGSVIPATRIADPALSTGSTAPLATSTTKPLNQGAVNNTQLSIDQIPALLQAALQSEDQSHANTLSGFDSAEQSQRGTYGKSSDTNQQNYDANYMDAIRAGVHGLGGLMNILRGSGAAGGTAEDQARDVVGDTTSNDIRTGADTRDTNQTSLDSSLTSFLTDLKGKRQAAEDTFTNNKRAINRDSSTQLQDLFTKMAGYFGDAGQTAQANDFMAKAGSLTPTIAANSKTQTSAYDTTPVVIHAPNLTAFAAPSQPDVATAPQDGQVGSGIFTMKKKDPSTTPIAAPVGA